MQLDHLVKSAVKKAQKKTTLSEVVFLLKTVLVSNNYFFSYSGFIII